MACHSYTLLYDYYPVFHAPVVRVQPEVQPVVIDIPGLGDNDQKWSYECRRDGLFLAPGTNCTKYFNCQGDKVDSLAILHQIMIMFSNGNSIVLLVFCLMNLLVSAHGPKMCTAVSELNFISENKYYPTSPSLYQIIK